MERGDIDRAVARQWAARVLSAGFCGTDDRSAAILEGVGGRVHAGAGERTARAKY